MKAKILHKHESSDPPLRGLKFNLANLPKWILLLLIKAYQKVVSPSLPPNTCRFYPTCSHYGYQAIYKYGAIKGGWLTIRRIIRCNPWNEGGIDFVP